ncbi:MAG: DUF6428 family protein [Chthoniobacteraceae bacterium]
MNISEFKKHLRLHPSATLRFQLPDGGLIPAHAHITEVARVDKTFVDCGGTVRKLSACVLQTWVADDVDHRFAPSKLANVMDKAAGILGDEDLPVEIEHEDFLISQFPISGALAEDGALVFTLTSKHADCLAKEECLPDVTACTPGASSCC